MTYSKWPGIIFFCRILKIYSAAWIGASLFGVWAICLWYAAKVTVLLTFYVGLLILLSGEYHESSLADALHEPELDVALQRRRAA